MSDPYADQAGTLSDPARDAVAITPDDAVDLGRTTRAVYVGATGTLRVMMASGTLADFTAVQAGTVYPLRVRRVLATGTSAGGLIALR